MLNPKLRRELIELLGPNRLLTSREELLSYSFDATAGVNGRLPEAVVCPQNKAQLVEVVKVAARHQVPIYPRGSGTNLSGGTIPEAGGLVVLTLDLNRILEIDDDNLTATVEPGVIVQSLNDAVAPLGLIYPPDPGTVATATMGGTVAECSGGLRGLKYGVTRDYVMGLEVVLADGSLVRFGGKTVKNVTGYDLTRLFIGSEGTLGLITEITVRLIPAPESRRSLIAVFDSVEDAGKTVSAIIKNRVVPATLEIMDRMTCETVEAFAKVGLPPGAEAILLIEVDGAPEPVERDAQTVANICQEHRARQVRLARDEADRDRLWAARRAALPALARLRPTTILEDATVPRSRIPEMLCSLNEIARRYDLLIGTFGHAGDGNLHPTILCDSRDPAEMERVHRAIEEIFRAALSLGGTLTGEHGIGLAKSGFLEWEFGTEGVEILRRVKEAFDPGYLFNRGKMVPFSPGKSA